MSARDDSAAQLRRIERVREGLRCTRMGLGLVVLLGVSSLSAAAATTTPARLAAGIAAWFVGQAAILAAGLLGLRALRRRRFGATPSSRIRRTSDALLYAAACAGGVVALTMFAPRLGDTMSTLGAAIGAVLLVGGLRAAALYVLRE